MSAPRFESPSFEDAPFPARASATENGSGWPFARAVGLSCPAITEARRVARGSAPGAGASLVKGETTTNALGGTVPSSLAISAATTETALAAWARRSEAARATNSTAARRVFTPGCLCPFGQSPADRSRGGAPAKLDPHQVEARRVQASRATQEEERGMHFGLVGDGHRAVHAVSVARQGKCSPELVAIGSVEVRKRLPAGDRIEAPDAGIPHPWTFLVRFGQKNGSLRVALRELFRQGSSHLLCFKHRSCRPRARGTGRVLHAGRWGLRAGAGRRIAEASPSGGGVETLVEGSGEPHGKPVDEPRSLRCAPVSGAAAPSRSVVSLRATCAGHPPPWRGPSVDPPLPTLTPCGETTNLFCSSLAPKPVSVTLCPRG